MNLGTYQYCQECGTKLPVEKVPKADYGRAWDKFIFRWAMGCIIVGFLYFVFFVL